MDLLRGIITAYEVQVNLVKGICLHKHKVDHIAHLGPSVATLGPKWAMWSTLCLCKHIPLTKFTCTSYAVIIPLSKSNPLFLFCYATLISGGILSPGWL